MDKETALYVMQCGIVPTETLGYEDHWTNLGDPRCQCGKYTYLEVMKIQLGYREETHD